MDHGMQGPRRLETWWEEKGQPQMQMHPACLSQRGGGGRGGTRGGDEKKVGTGACGVRSDSSMDGVGAHSDRCVYAGRTLPRSCGVSS